MKEKDIIKLYKNIIDKITEETLQLTAMGFEPTHIICDPENYTRLYNAIKSQATPFLLATMEVPQSFKKINICGYILVIIQRVEKEFEGISVYGRRKNG